MSSIGLDGKYLLSTTGSDGSKLGKNMQSSGYILQEEAVAVEGDSEWTREAWRGKIQER